MASFCTSCGAPVAENARFCTGCGRATEDRPAAAVPATPSPAQPQPWAAVAPAAPPWSPAAGIAVARRGSRVPLIAGAVVLIVVAAVASSLFLTGGPADAVTGHLSALTKGDDASAYAFTATAFRKETSLADFTKFVNAYPVLRGSKASITSRSVNGDTGLVEVDLVPSSGATRSATFQLVKEGGDWRILGYELKPIAATTPAATPAATPNAATPRPSAPAAAPSAAPGAATKVCGIDAIPAATGVELIKNGTFDQGTTGWVEAKYFTPNRDTAKEISVSNGVATFAATARASTRAGLVQTLNVDVTGATKIELSAKLRADSAVLGGTGQQGREAPIAFGAVYYDDACVLHNGLPETPTATASRMFWGGLYLKDPGPGETAAFGEKTQAGQWTQVTVDLTKLRATVIVLVGVEGSGWAPRSGSADTISLTVTR